VKLTDEQLSAAEQTREWFETREPGDMTIGGLAGTGKTTLARVLPETLGVSPASVAYCAFTGKAASVLNKKLTGAKATTIHGLIYQHSDIHCAACPRSKNPRAHCHGDCYICSPKWVRRETLDDNVRLIIVDEASMISKAIYEDLTAFRVPIIWIGDHGQLPPIGGSFNLMNDPRVRLETIHRQVADSPILKLAMMARESGKIPFGEYGPGVRKRRKDGTLDMDEGDWSGDTLVLAGRNKTRVNVNKAVRAERGFPKDTPVPGDRVICLRNNHDKAIYNGLLGTLRAIHIDGFIYNIEVDCDDGTVYSGTVPAEQFNASTTLHEEFGRNVDLWDFGYCLTVHKAQGSEANKVLLIEERMTRDLGMYKRWLYTGITRAKAELEIIS
jgi:exodeoxyribonuclease-5